jgi:hypothetical protein
MKKNLILTLVFFSMFICATKLSAQTDYKTAIGARLGWGFGGSVKHFINDKAALEGVVRFRSFGITGFTSYSYINISGMYQQHNDIQSVSGLKWYYGGGATVGLYSGDFIGTSTQFGIIGCLGLDYKFDGTPINISLDWLPSFFFSTGTGFGGDGGGLAVRYTF